MPRSRSISIVSSTCSRISRASSPPQVWISRSASVDLPWSICAMIAKLRIWLSGVVMTFQRVPPEHKVGAAPDQREPTRQIDVQERQMRVSVVLAGRERRGNRDFKCIEPMKRRDLITAIPAAAILRSAAGRAQSLQVPLIGFVHGSAPVGQYKSYVASFVAGLREEDFESGRNVAVEYRWAEGEYERVPGLTTDLLSLKPSLIVAYGPPEFVAGRARRGLPRRADRLRHWRRSGRGWHRGEPCPPRRQRDRRREPHQHARHQTSRAVARSGAAGQHHRDDSQSQELGRAGGYKRRASGRPLAWARTCRRARDDAGTARPSVCLGRSARSRVTVDGIAYL